MPATNDTPFDNAASLVPAKYAFSITPHDTNELSHVTRGLLVGVAGNVNVVLAGDTDAVVIALAAGIIHPLRAKIVKSTSTTATGIVGVY